MFKRAYELKKVCSSYKNCWSNKQRHILLFYSSFCSWGIHPVFLWYVLIYDVKRLTDHFVSLDNHGYLSECLTNSLNTFNVCISHYTWSKANKRNLLFTVNNICNIKFRLNKKWTFYRNFEERIFTCFSVTSFHAFLLHLLGHAVVVSEDQLQVQG